MQFGVRGIVLPATPTSSDVARILRKAPDSATGPDGIPYSAWRAAGPRGHSILSNMFVHLLQGHVPPRSYNASLLVCPPKGSRTSDASGAFRTASKTRPLGFKNFDTKTVAALLARPLAAAANAVIPRHQRGLLPSRRTLGNVLEFDTFARARWRGL